MFVYIYNKHYHIPSSFFFLHTMAVRLVNMGSKEAGRIPLPSPWKNINKVFIDKNEDERDQHRKFQTNITE